MVTPSKHGHMRRPHTAPGLGRCGHSQHSRKSGSRCSKALSTSEAKWDISSTHTHKKFLKLPQLNSPDVISFVAIRLCLLFHILIKTTQTKIICLLKTLFFSLKSAFPSPSSAAWCYLNSSWHHQAAVPVHPAQPLHHSPRPAQAVGAQLQSLRKQDGYF